MANKWAEVALRTYLIALGVRITPTEVAITTVAHLMATFAKDAKSQDTELRIVQQMVIQCMIPMTPKVSQSIR